MMAQFPAVEGYNKETLEKRIFILFCYRNFQKMCGLG